jgi:hypothetical protein
VRKIRASELGRWAYCQRAWGYARMGKCSANQAEMDTGSAGHQRHAAGLKASSILGILAGLSLAVVIILLVLQVTR